MQRITHDVRSFDGFTLDLTRGCLLRGTQEIKLQPRPFGALAYLVDNPGRLIEKAELIQVLWPDTAVTDDSLVQCIGDVRRALGDEAQQIIKTVTRRGYIFDRPLPAAQRR
jgi:adenylate cyclase